MFRNLIVKILIKYLSRELSDIPKQTLEKEVYDGMMSQLWQSAAFRQYVQNRDARLIFTMAGSEGMLPEPRDAYVLHTGQRVELLLLASEAKKAWNRMDQGRLKKVEEVVP